MSRGSTNAATESADARLAVQEDWATRIEKVNESIGPFTMYGTAATGDFVRTSMSRIESLARDLRCGTPLDDGELLRRLEYIRIQLLMIDVCVRAILRRPDLADRFSKVALSDVSDLHSQITQPEIPSASQPRVKGKRR